MLKMFRSLFVLSMVYIFLIAGIQPVLACGPFFFEPVFGFSKHAEYPLSDYTGGKTGLIPNSYGRISLFVYYRYLNDLPLSETEQKEVARAIGDRIGSDHWGGDAPEETDNAKPEPSASDRWMETSNGYRSSAGKPSDSMRSGSYYSYFANCLDGAYETASETLRKRIKSGYSRQLIGQWTNAQDAVFSNCSEDGIMPPVAAKDAPVWLQQDREYQTAAALFYRSQYADSRNAFELIARDKSSEWSKISDYLVARTLIREASSMDVEDAEGNPVTPDEAKKKSLLADAAGRLNRIISDAEMSELHSASRNLLNLVKYRLDPGARTKELSARLTDVTQNDNIYNDLTDYIWLLDQIELKGENENSSEDNDGMKLAGIPEDSRNEDLTDWLMSYQAVDGFDHALQRWNATKKPQWLAAAITKADVKTAEKNELINAANELKPGTTAFATGMYHAIRLARENGDRDQAARLTEKVFAAGFKDVPGATKNSFYTQRLDSTKDLSEFLKYAKLEPTGYLWSDDFNESGGPIEMEDLASWKNRKMFGEDAVDILNKTTPLSVWLEAALNDEVPGYLRDFIAASGWTRAFMLKDSEHERLFTPLVAEYSKEYAPRFSTYMKARTASDREAAALIMIGRYAVIGPSIEARWGRKGSGAESIDSNRGNWWCVDRLEGAEHPRPAFLSDSEYEKGRSEFNELQGLGEASTAFTTRALEFAKTNPRHRDTPEILHLAVRTTRYGCRDANTGAVSNAAFRLLHSRYRNSAWTKRTPFWFKTYEY